MLDVQTVHYLKGRLSLKSETQVFIEHEAHVSINLYNWANYYLL